MSELNGRSSGRLGDVDLAIDTSITAGRMRSVSEVYSMESPSYMLGSPDRKLFSKNENISRCVSPIIPSIEATSMGSEVITNDGETYIGKSAQSSEHLMRSSNQTRGRLFSELSISDMPSESVDETLPTLNISFPCSYEENMEVRGKSIVQLRQAAIKRVIVRTGAKMSRYNIVYTKEHCYWPQETIRHCRTGRIKRGMVLKRQFGIYYPEKGHDLIALKVMEKTAISESFQWDEDDVQTELGVMKELSMNGGHENVLFMYDALETKEYLIAVMELVDGDLHDMLASVQGSPTVVDVFYQILLGYQFIVKQGYYHCDLSLENVLVKLVPNYHKSGKARVIAKLSDFGRVRKMDANGSAVIEFDEIAGKPYYLAPEAYTDSYEAGPADIWSLGIILFILITGNPPFGIANDSDEVFEPFSTIGFEYLVPTLQKHNASEEEIKLLSQLLEIDPNKRPKLDSILQLAWLSLHNKDLDVPVFLRRCIFV